MPIDASPSGTLDIENATLRSREIVALTSMVTGNDVIRSSNPPALEVYGDPSHGGNEARLELVSNTATVSSKAFTRLTSNAGVFSVKSGTDASDNGTITFGGFTNERMRIGSDGNVGVGTDSPEVPFNVVGNNALSGNPNNAIASFRATTAVPGTNDAGVVIGSINGNTPYIADVSSASTGLSFYTQNNPRMRILANGNVGIGTTNPFAPLEVHGADLTGQPTGTTCIISRHVAGLDGVLNIFGVAASNGEETLGLQTQIDGRAWATDIAAGWDYGNESRYDLCLQPYKGRVGIGITNPGGLMDIRAVASDPSIPTVHIGDNGADYGDYGMVNLVRNPTNAGSKAHLAFIRSGNTVFSQGFFNDTNTFGFWPSFSTVAHTPGMAFATNGNVGIGTESPITKLGVKTAGAASPGAAWGGNDFMVGRHGPNTNTQSLGVAIGTDHGNDGNSVGTIWCMRPELTWNTLKLLGNYVQLSSVTTNGVILSGGTVVTSDDRLKTDEALIKNATSTLMKLKPQTYNKHKNLPNSEDESQIDNAGIPYNKSGMEAGLMVQDVYYDAPELKHLVLLSDDAAPRETKPEEPVPNDLQQDPDYSDWGVKPSNLNYTGLTPYIIKSIQEINTELPRHKTKIDGIPFSNISAYHNLIVSKDSVVRLSNTYNDKTVYGVISETEASTDDSEVLVNYQGDGKVWVINTSNIEAGDYITTSNISGYGMKQATDFTTNYTLAKSTIACDFTQPHITEKRKVQELRDVTYWSVTKNIDISKKRYDYIASNNINLVTTTTETYYSNVTLEELSGNTMYSNITTQEYSALESDKQNNYTEVLETKYFLISTREYSLDPRNETSNVIVRQEYVDVLDGNGQIQWEDTGNTVPMYELRYLDSDGIQTDEANAVHKAALIECTFKTG